VSATPAIQPETSPTPILDRLAPIPERRNTAPPNRSNVIAGIIAVCLPLLLIGLMIWSPSFLTFAEKALRSANNFLDKAINLILSEGWRAVASVSLLPLFLFSVIVIHEVGHLVLGFLVGFRLIAIRFGPIHISLPFRISFKFEKKTGRSGFANMIPVRSDRLRSRAIVFIAGGPLANLMVGAIILSLGFGRPLAAAFAALSIVVGLANLIPFRRSALVSDGKRLLTLFHKREQGERFLAILQLAAELQSGVEPEALSPDFLAKAKAGKNESPDTVMAYALAYTAAWYQNNDDATAQLLETCLEYSQFTPPSMREALKCDAAIFQARKRKRIDLAEQWLSEIPEKAHIPGLRLRAESAILEARGDLEGALKKLDEVETTIIATHDRYQRPLSLRLLQRWRSELQAQRTPVSPSNQHSSL
jgi:hypothetical protein